MSDTLLVGEGAPAGAPRAPRTPPAPTAPAPGLAAPAPASVGKQPRMGTMESSQETEVTVTTLFLLAALLAAVLAYCAASMIIMRAGRSTPPEDLECLIVLGAMVRPDGLPTRALRYRLEAARSYLAEHPTTIAIVSGGQGADEPVSEAAAMACWLADRSVGSERIIQESTSTTTAENLSLSTQLVPGLRKRRIGIVTNDFHLYRSLLIARKQGFQRVWGVPAASTPENLPVNLARECFALIKNRIQGNL